MTNDELQIKAPNDWPWGAHGVESLYSPDNADSLPKISIVIPSFNQGKYIEKTIRSVILQKYPKLELIVMDGGSSDETLGVLDRYIQEIYFIESKPDRGQSHAINKGLLKATGEILGWLNSDDYYSQGTLEVVARRYANIDMSKVGAIVGAGNILSESGDELFRSQIKRVSGDTLFGWAEGRNFMQPSCFFTRKAWEECGPLDENLHYAMDLDLWFKIASRFEFDVIEDMLSHSLAHAHAKTTSFVNSVGDPHSFSSLLSAHQEMAVIFARHGNIEQGLKLLAKDSNNYLALYEDVVRDRKSLAYRFAVFARTIKQRLWLKNK